VRSDKYTSESEYLYGRVPMISIGVDNFQKEVLEESSPVLVLCMRRDSEFQEQIEVILSTCNSYGENLKICIIEEECIETLKENFGVEGTPTFLIFTGGLEKGRMLGQAEQKTLEDLLSRTLPIDQGMK
jgi:thioredoxin-like negative regulator of GroEL